MSNNFFQSSKLKFLLLLIYRFYVSFIKSKNNKIFLNSIPKSGTHLLLGILTEIDGFIFSGYHIEIWDLHKSNFKNQSIKNFKFDKNKLKNILGKIKSGQIITGHLSWNQEVYNEIKSCKSRLI